MNRHQILEDQLKKAIQDFEEAQEIDKLSKKHTEINREIKDKAQSALQKHVSGQKESNPEQEEIDKLAKKQDEVFGQMTDKILKMGNSKE